MKSKSKKSRQIATVALLVGCGLSTVVGCAVAPDPADQNSSLEPASAGTKIENCGNSWNIDGPPTSVVVTKNTTPLTLDRLGVLDKVAAKAGVFPPEYYSADLNSKLARIPTLSDKLDAGGHLQISRESILEKNPDLVTGFTDTVNDQTLAAAGIPVVDEPSLCGSTARATTFEDVYAHVDFYAEIFGVQAKAAEFNAQLRQRVQEQQAHPAGRGRSVAVVYPSSGGTTVYAYGGYSLSAAVTSAAGLRDAFEKEPKRVFEVSAEELIAADPDIIVAAYSQGQASQAADRVRAIGGARSITAIKENQVIPMLLNQLDPPTPLAVDGLEELNRELAVRS